MERLNLSRIPGIPFKFYGLYTEDQNLIKLGKMIKNTNNLYLFHLFTSISIFITFIVLEIIGTTLFMSLLIGGLSALFVCLMIITLIRLDSLVDIFSGLFEDSLEYGEQEEQREKEIADQIKKNNDIKAKRFITIYNTLGSNLSDKEKIDIISDNIF